MNQKGFTPLHTVLILVFAALIVGTGYYVYQATNKADDALSRADEGSISTIKSKKQSVSVSGSETNIVIPDDWTNYNNKELGLKFAYPKVWGGVTIKDGAETGHLIKGSEKVIIFSANKNITGGFKSTDWEHDPAKGHDGNDEVPGYVTQKYQDFRGNDLYFASHIKEGDSFLISTEFGGIGCTGVGELLIKQLRKSATYPAVVFRYIDHEYIYEEKPKDGSPTSTNDFGCYGQDAKNYISSAHVEEMKILYKSITIL